MSPRKTRQTLTSFWEIVAFMATSFVFLLLGATDWPVAAGGRLAVHRRCICRHACREISERLPNRQNHEISWREMIPPMWAKILAAAGLRGAVTVALTLSLPDNFPFRAELISMTFGVALLSIVIQVELLQWYLGRSSALLHLKTGKTAKR